ncbi:uncharacterized protein L201_005177 [Kwoniella dendrophila CBS 6074]|uniref:COX assembly mitochondrial protein n=1 Tax=Kwoniella dendrophila CBS 6074 TaxID=1295534 RepID=A0AAX4JZE5_9TREE
MPSGNFRFKVRPRKDQIVVPCAPELTSLLACFATTGDLRHTQQCSESAKALQMCMSNRHVQGGKGKSSYCCLIGIIWNIEVKRREIRIGYVCSAEQRCEDGIWKNEVEV